MSRLLPPPGLSPAQKACPGMLSFAALKEAVGVEPFLAGGDPRQAWRSPEAVAHVQLVLDSFARFVGRELVPRNAPTLEQARMVFEAPFVVASHGNEADSPSF